MLRRVPDYYDAFSCLAGACPHTCCAKWEVVIDPESARRYAQVPGALGEKLRRVLHRDEDGDFCFALEGERCPFLDGRGLCEIHTQLGRAATSITCREHPRMTEDYGAFCEVTLSASCPAANALLLGSREPLRFLSQGEAEPIDDPELAQLLRLRDGMLAMLEDRREPLRRRLSRFLGMAAAAQERWDTGECIDSALDDAADSAALPVFPDALTLLTALETLEPDWPTVLARARSVDAAAPEELLERIAVYFAFHYLLKAINDGDLWGQAQLCVYSTLAVERLSGVLGLAEALRRFSCEVEHSQENLDALREALAW